MIDGSLIKSIAAICCLLFIGPTALAQDSPASKEKQIYNQLKAFSLKGDAVDVKGLALKKDRVQLTLDGVVYLSEPVEGMITGAVFIGEGKFVTETPADDFERDNVKRLLGADLIASDFKTAVFRFTDDTAKQFGPVTRDAGVVNEQAQKLGRETDESTLHETGANLPARLAISLLNLEKPGFFFAEFNGGKRNRFSVVLDHQNRIPVANFGIDAGEKGLIWSYNSGLYFAQVWLAFYALQDYQRGRVIYSDANNQIDIKHFRMDVDLRDHGDRLKLRTLIQAEPLQPNLRALTFIVGRGLSEFDNERLKKQMRVKSARFGGVELPWAQENWESGLTVFLPEPLKTKETVELELSLEGDFMTDWDFGQNCYYPRSTVGWYPRHGFLDRSTYDLTFRHPKRLRVASVGTLISEDVDPEDGGTFVSKYQLAHPVSLVTFGLGDFKRRKDSIKWDNGGSSTPLEFSELRSDEILIKEDFILAELNNSIRYFSKLFGSYPYPTFGAAFHPLDFGQAFPSLVLIPLPPRERRNTKAIYQFIGHETAHQWWGHIVSWRSYRDQWLSEGFAEYSGILYAGARVSQDTKNDMLRRLRISLKEPPVTPTGLGKGRLVDVGPIILGNRLLTTKTGRAREVLIYNKGALVLRMIHFMLTDPETGDGSLFTAMMTDFVNRYRNNTASSDDFRNVVNEHFAKSPVARNHGLKNLNWLFSQFVYQTAHPSYEMQYKIEDQPGGKATISGTVFQKNAPRDWIMLLPVKFSFAGDQIAEGSVLVQGESSPFQIQLPARPKKVELDPDRWILADEMSIKGN